MSEQKPSCLTTICDRVHGVIDMFEARALHAEAQQHTYPQESATFRYWHHRAVEYHESAQLLRAALSCESVTSHDQQLCA